MIDCDCGDEDCGAFENICINDDVDFYNDPSTGNDRYDQEHSGDPQLWWLES